MGLEKQAALPLRAALLLMWGPKLPDQAPASQRTGAAGAVFPGSSTWGGVARMARPRWSGRGTL